MPAAKIWVKKKLSLGTLTVPQQGMAAIGFAGLHSVKSRIKAGRNAYDAPAKSLNPKYAKWKQKVGRQPIRDLFLSVPFNLARARKLKRAAKKAGKRFLMPGMMANLTLRTVTDNRVGARFTTADQRQKAEWNQKREPFVLFSENNQQTVITVARPIVNTNFQKIVKNG